MKRFFLGIAGLFTVGLSLVACTPSVADQCASSKNPTECAQYTNAGGNVNDYLLYGMAGYMLHSVMSGGQRQTVIVRDTNYHGYVAPRRIPSQQAQIARLQAKVANQRAQLASSQAANARYKSQIASGRTTSTYRSYGTSYRPSYTPSYRSSYSSSGSSFRSSSSFGRR